MNELGARRTDPSALTQAITSFTGPMMFQAGPLACGATSIVGIAVPAVCASRMGVQRYMDRTWTPIEDGNTGQPMDVTSL